jgi:hypothetical protein
MALANIPDDVSGIEDLPQVVRISLVDMPFEEQWQKFEAFLANNPGGDTIVVGMPDGELTMDGRYSISADSQPMLSLMLGGASMTISPETVDTDLVTEGMEL